MNNEHKNSEKSVSNLNPPTLSSQDINKLLKP